MKFLVPFVAICSLGMLATVRGAPFNSYDTIEELVVPESKVIDFDNLTESERSDLLRNQINITAVKLQQQRLRDEAAQKNLQRAGAPMAIKQSATEPNVSSHAQNRKAFEKQIIGNIRQSIESNLMRNDSYIQMGATHEMAFSAVCDLPKHTEQSVWDDQFTWNLYFRLTHSKPYTSVSSAILRLYMKGSNSTDGDSNRRDDENCKNPAEPMIRITVSVYMRKKNKDNSVMERKKRICSSITVTKNYRGWITLDTLLAVKQWDKPNRNMGIAIDVQDHEDQPLHAATFFQPADCLEASKANATAAVLPWSFFRNSLSWSSDEMDDVPHVPRIDIMMMHKPLYQHYQHHSHHSRPIFRPKHQHPHHHYGGVRYRLDNASGPSSSSSSSSSVANSFESVDEVEIKQHPSVHVHHSQAKPHKKRHLNHNNQQQHVARHRVQFENNSAESDEDYSASSASLEERKL
ncbi:protein anachronism [Culex pipiens pallens]|uniref:protein anachronism n=1 Tax=Culex pipiens pallens TaxID=42434 RepID=UPI0019548D84|nr:protein anachronism [Culex pipiens pallens]